MKRIPAAISILTTILVSYVTVSSTGAQNSQLDSWADVARVAGEKMSHGNLHDAQIEYQNALELSEQQNKVDPGIVTCLSQLALINHKLGNLAESERLYELVMRDLEGLYGPTSSKFADWMPDLAWLYDEHGKSEKAEVLLKRILHTKEATFGQDDLSVASSLDLYARFLRRHQRDSEASALELRAKSIRYKESP